MGGPKDWASFPAKAVQRVQRTAWIASIALNAERGTEVMSLPPREIFLEVSAHCNIKCPMCPVTTGFERARGTMSYDLFESGLHELSFSFDGPTRERYDRVRVGGDYDDCVRLIRRVMAEKRARRSALPVTKIQVIYFQGEDPDEQRREMAAIFADDLPDELKIVPAIDTSDAMTEPATR